MYTYEVRCALDNRSFVEMVRANSGGDAQYLAKAKWGPSLVIYAINRVG